MGEEGLEKTSHNKIFVAEPLDITMEDIKEKLNKFEELLSSGEEKVKLQDVKNVMKLVVPTYKEADEVNKRKEE